MISVLDPGLSGPGSSYGEVPNYSILAIMHDLVSKCLLFMCFGIGDTRTIFPRPLAPGFSSGLDPNLTASKKCKI